MSTWNNERHEAARSRCEAATAGPWEAQPDRTGTATIVLDPEGDPLWDAVGTLLDKDGEFIAHARIDIPALLDEIERLRAEVERLMPFESHVSWLWGDTEPGKTPADMVDRGRRRLLLYLVSVHYMSPEAAVEMATDMALDVLEAALQPTVKDKTGEDALTIATALEAALNDDDVEAYIATRCEDFTPDPPTITDDMVERAAEALVYTMGQESDGACWISEGEVWTVLDGTFDMPNAVRAALEAALNPKENEA